MRRRSLRPGLGLRAQLAEHYPHTRLNLVAHGARRIKRIEPGGDLERSDLVAVAWGMLKRVSAAHGDDDVAGGKSLVSPGLGVLDCDVDAFSPMASAAVALSDLSGSDPPDHATALSR